MEKLNFTKQGEQIPVSPMVANHSISSHNGRLCSLQTDNSSNWVIPYRSQKKCPAPFWSLGVRVHSHAMDRAAAVV